MNNKQILFGVIILYLLLISAGIFLIWSNITIKPSEDFGEAEWKDFFRKKGIIHSDSTKVYISEAREVKPGFVEFTIKQQYNGPKEDNKVMTLEETSYVYIDMETGLTLTAATYTTTPNAKEEQMKIFMEQLDPSSMDYSMDKYYEYKNRSKKID